MAASIYDSPFLLTQFPGLTLTVTYVAVTSSDSVVIAANPQRRWLGIWNRDVGFVDLNFGVAAVAGNGLPLAAAGALGGQGGGYVWDKAAVVQAVHAISTAGSHLTIVEGV